MGLYLKQDETRSQLSSRVTSSVASRLQKRSLENDDTRQANILKNQQKTTGGGLFWFIIISIVTICALIYVIFIL